ncbi:MAG: c-type cytochrome [Gammaproteobacteria bacterium]|jgi:mono/diheme cytochrome c family protein
MRIEVYLNDDATPQQTLTPPEQFELDTTQLPDGKHTLIFKAIEDNGDTSQRHMTFYVQNGPSISIHGIRNDDRLSGEIAILANAYSSNIGDEFEPVRMETPAPIPTWAWVLFLSILAWGAGYLSLEVHNRVRTPELGGLANQETSLSSPAQRAGEPEAAAAWQALGEQVYGNNCSSCHQADGSGLAGVFPPLKGNSVVLDDDPKEHILAVLEGVADKVIDGVPYASPMPGFAAMLNDEEVAAVVNHERTQWGNRAPTVTANDVTPLR